MEYILDMECERESERIETVFCRLCDNCCIGRQAGRRYPHTKHSIVVCASFSSRFISTLSSISLLLCVSFALSIGRFLLYFLSPCPSFSHSFHRFSSFARCDSAAFVIFSLTHTHALSLSFLKHCHYYYYSHWPRVHGMYIYVSVCMRV